MKIVYWGNCKKVPKPTQDQEVLKALQEVAEVQFFDIKDFDMPKLLKATEGVDMFLFHAQIPTADEITQMLIVERIQVVLRAIKCKKVLWFMEKVWLGKGQIIERLLPDVDYAFFIDGTWVRRMKGDNIFELPQAAPLKQVKGKFRPELACDIAYIGQMYGLRQKEYEFLKEKLGERIKFYDNKFGRDLADLCKSAKVILTPRFPFDDFYWSDRIYTLLSMGALVIHQRSQGLKDEGFEDGKHFFEYDKDQELMALLEDLLSKDMVKVRRVVTKNGQEFVKTHTYRERVKQLLDTVYESKNIK